MADIPAGILADIANVQKLADVSAALVAQPPIGEVVRQTYTALDALSAKLTTQYGEKAQPLVSALRNHFATIHFQGASAGNGPVWESEKQRLLSEMTR